jgi:hypothetical protein
MKIPTDQEKLIHLIKEHNNPGANLAKSVASVLGISLNGAYKRINGTLSFSLEDASKLAKEFSFSLDQLLPDRITRFNALFSGFHTERSAMDYMDIVKNEMEDILSNENCQTWLVTNDLPDGYYYYYKELALLRYYIWERMGWKHNHLDNVRFSFQLSDKMEVLGKIESLNALYQRIPTVEIWNYNVFHNICWQIIYLAESGDFKDASVPLRLCDRLNDLLDHIKQMVIEGKRFIPGTSPENGLPYHVFIHPSMHNHNIILVKSGDELTAYPVLDNPNFIKITDPKITGYLYDLMGKFQRQSSPLSNIKNNDVKPFFDRVSLQLSILREEVERLMTRRFL